MELAAFGVTVGLIVAVVLLIQSEIELRSDKPE